MAPPARSASARTASTRFSERTTYESVTPRKPSPAAATPASSATRVPWVESKRGRPVAELEQDPPAFLGADSPAETVAVELLRAREISDAEGDHAQVLLHRPATLKDERGLVLNESDVVGGAE